MIFLLAHGALGIWDEVIFVSIAAIFIVMMGISWVRSRNMDVPSQDADSIPAARDHENDIQPPDRFELD